VSKVRDAMVPEPLALDAAATAQEAGERLSDPEVRAVLVCKDGALVGVVTRKTLVREIVAAGRVPRRGLLGRLRPQDREAVEEAIERVGLGARADGVLSRLSGGQQQRAFIAKALAARPELLVLDEPTAGVDVDAQESLAGLLEELHRDLDATILFVSHEFGAVERFVERLVLLRGGIVFDGPPTALPPSWHDPSHVHL
jgi:zinc transport system ATP-binding protein